MSNHELEDDVQKPIMEAGQYAGKKATKKAGKSAKRAANKATRSVGKAIVKAGMAVSKAIFAAIAPFLPWILAFLALVGLIIIAYYMLLESPPATQEFQREETSQMNDYENAPNDQGYYDVKSLSEGNKLVRAFYTYFSDRSYWILTEDSDELKSPDDPEIEKREIKDKYNREELFYLSPNALFVLDEFLHEGKFRVPEQFIQPVPYERDEDSGELKLIDIWDDEESKMNVKSTKYDSDGKPTGKKIEGVWDYGLAPVFNYKEFEEEMQYRGRVTQVQKWDKKNQRTIWVTASDDEIEQVETKSQSLGTSWMIDQVVSPGGTIRNDITHEWADTGEQWFPDPSDYAFTKKVDVLVWKEKQVVNDEGEELYIIKDEEKNTVSYTTEETDEPYMKLVSEYEKQERTFYKKVEGTKWEKIPSYNGEPDLSDITGTKYYRDYIENYETYIPEDVMTTFDIAKRLNTTDEELKKLLEETDDGVSTTVGSVDVEGLELGSSASNATYEQALTNLPYFVKYGKVYGVDPYLLVALTAQEAGGSHYNKDGSVKSAANIGLMQISKLGKDPSYRRSVTTYNFETGKKETFSASLQELHDIETNIKWGTMYLANVIKGQDYRVLEGLQAYNFGSYEGDWSIEQSLKLQEKFAKAGGYGKRKDPDSPLGPWAFGDAYYPLHVLRYYASPDSAVPYAITDDGDTITLDNSELPIGTVESINASILNSQSNNGLWNSFNNTIRNLWDDIKKGIQNTFGIEDKPREQFHGIDKDEPRIQFIGQQDYQEADIIIKSMLAYDEGNLLSHYNDFTEEDFKERFKLLFSNPLGQSMSMKTDLDKGVDPATFFKDGYVSPVTNPKVVTKYGFIEIDGESEYHSGIDITVADGQEIRAVADGEVVHIEKTGDTEVMIQHDLGTVTVYRFVSDISVKVGDDVKKGDKIAEGGNNSEKKGTFHLELRQYDSTKDPTWIVDPSLVKSGGVVIIDPNAKGVLQSPFAGRGFRLTSPFGMRTLQGITRMHNGVDIVDNAGAGATIHAVYDGEVVRKSNDTDGYGHYIVIDHGVVSELNGTKKLFTLYAHMQSGSVSVSVGDSVEKGASVGKMGNSGRSFGAHLHFETRFGNGVWSSATPINPEKLIELR